MVYIEDCETQVVFKHDLVVVESAPATAPITASTAKGGSENGIDKGSMIGQLRERHRQQQAALAAAKPTTSSALDKKGIVQDIARQTQTSVWPVDQWERVFGVITEEARWGQDFWSGFAQLAKPVLEHNPGYVGRLFITPANWSKKSASLPRSDQNPAKLPLQTYPCWVWVTTDAEIMKMKCFAQLLNNWRHWYVHVSWFR